MKPIPIKPVEVRYKGYRLRSRLEARYAVMLDALEVEWHYEPDCFDLPSGRYLPDFWLPKFNVFAEVKSMRFTDAEMSKARELVIASGRPLLMLEGAPHSGTYRMLSVDGVARAAVSDFDWKDRRRVALAVNMARGARFGETRDVLTSDLFVGLPDEVRRRLTTAVLSIETGASR